MITIQDINHIKVVLPNQLLDLSYQPLSLSIHLRTLFNSFCRYTRFDQHDFCYHIVTNRLLTWVHQDPLGIPRRPKKNKYSADYSTNKQVVDTQVWARPSCDGAIGVVFFNSAEEPRNIIVTFEDIGLPSSSPTTTVTTTNVWIYEIHQNVSSPIVATGVVPQLLHF